MTFEELVEYLGLDEPEIIDYNSGAEFGGLTEEQSKYIVSEFINGRPVYIMASLGGGSTKSVSQESTSEIVCTDTTLLLDGSFIVFSSMSANQILGSNVNIILAGSNSSIDNGGSSYA